MSHLSEEEKNYIDDKFEEFKIHMFKKLKLPAIGAAVIFAGLISAFASYVYVKARADILNAQITFYEGLQTANNEIAATLNKFNILAGKAEESVARLKGVEDDLAEFFEEGEPDWRQIIDKDKKDKLDVIKKTKKEYFKINPTVQQQLQSSEF